MIHLNHWSDIMINTNNQTAFNQLNFAQNSERYFQKEHLKSKSSGLGFYILSYYLAMNAVVIAVTVFFTIVYTFQGHDVDYVLNQLTDSGSMLMHFMTILAAVSAAVIPGLFYLKLSKNHISDCIKTKFVKPSLFIPFLFLGMAVSMVANASTEIVAYNFSLFGLENNLDMSSSSSSLICNILYVIATAITPAFAEEFAFRGILLGVLRKYGDSFAIIVSAIMFGAMHGNIIQIPFAFMLGLIFGYITCKTNSVIPAITIHFINNFYAVLLDILQTEGYVSEPTFYLIYYVLIFLFCAIGALSLFIILKKDKYFLNISDNSNVVSLTLKEKVTTFMTSPGVLVCLPLFLITTITCLLPITEV